MLNPKKIAGLLIMVISILVLVQPKTTFAKSAASRNAATTQKKSQPNKYKNLSLKFNFETYDKLSKRQQLQYLQIFSELSSKLEKVSTYKRRKTADYNFIDELQNILFPLAEAANPRNGVCLNGGVFFEFSGTCPDTIPESHRFSNLTSYYPCGIQQRCAAYFGVDANGNGFCYSSASGATASCRDQSNSADGRRRLQELLAKCPSSGGTVASSGSADFQKCVAFRQAMAEDSKNIDRYCKSDNNARPWCAAAREGLGSVASDTDGAAATTTTANPAGTAGQGCMAAEVDAMNASIGSSDGGNRADPFWHRLATIGGSGACGGRSYEEITRTVGQCMSNNSVTAAEVEQMISSNDALKNAIAKLISDPNYGRTNSSEFQAENRQFMDFFGLSIDEYRKFFCAKEGTLSGNSNATDNAMRDFGRALAQGQPLPERPGYAAARNRMRSCITSSITLETTNSGGQAWRSNRTYNRCSFRSSDNVIYALVANADQYKGKIYFEDNAGRCFSFDNSRLDTNRQPLITLAPLPGSTYRPMTLTQQQLQEGYRAFEYSCSAREGTCSLDNDCVSFPPRPVSQ